MATRTAELGRSSVLGFVSTCRWWRFSQVSLGYAPLAPAVVLLRVSDLFPLFYGIYNSACDWRISCVRIIGVDNYTRALNDPAMRHALWVTATDVVISVPMQFWLALFFAYLLFQEIRGREALRVASFVPYVTSTVASAAVWGYLYSPDKGLINTVLKWMNLPHSDCWANQWASSRWSTRTPKIPRGAASHSLTPKCSIGSRT